LIGNGFDHSLTGLTGVWVGRRFARVAWSAYYRRWAQMGADDMGATEMNSNLVEFGRIQSNAVDEIIS